MENQIYADADVNNAVIRVAAYHRQDWDFSFIRFHPKEHAEIRTSIVEAFRTPPTADLGLLDKLPPELFNEMFLELDILSCFCFRQVNRRARDVISSIKEYEAVARYGLDSLRATLLTDIAEWFTIDDLYQILCTPACARCGCFGDFLFLHTLTRGCYDCIMFAPEYITAHLPAFCMWMDVPLESMDGLLPVVYSIPGIYTNQDRNKPNRYPLVELEAAIEAVWAAEDLKFDDGKENLVRSRIDDQMMARYMSSIAMPYLDVKTRQIHQGMNCKGCYIASVAPVIYDFQAVFGPREKVFSRGEFLKHFDSCVEAQKLWASSLGGLVPLDEPEFLRRGGYLGERD